MVNTLFDTVWRDISPFAVGFDRTFDALSIMANSKSQSINYPHITSGKSVMRNIPLNWQLLVLTRKTLM